MHKCVKRAKIVVPQMPTEAMRLDAEEEAARGAVEHLLKTLERDAPGKLPAQEAPPVEPKGNQILRPLNRSSNAAPSD